MNGLKNAPINLVDSDLTESFLSVLSLDFFDLSSSHEQGKENGNPKKRLN